MYGLDVERIYLRQSFSSQNSVVLERVFRNYRYICYICVYIPLGKMSERDVEGNISLEPRTQ